MEIAVEVVGGGSRKRGRVNLTRDNVTKSLLRLVGPPGRNEEEEMKGLLQEVRNRVIKAKSIDVNVIPLLLPTYDYNEGQTHISKVWTGRQPHLGL